MDDLYCKTKLKIVQDIDDDILDNMAASIQMLLKRDNRYYLVKNPVTDYRGVSCLWEAKPGEKVGVFGPLNHHKIISFHKFGAPSLFKPSIAEVMSAIRTYVEDWTQVKYFYLESDLDASHCMDTVHWTYCHLFGKHYPIQGE